MARCNSSRFYKRSLAIPFSVTKVEWSNSSVMRFSPNFQVQKWLCAPQRC